MDDPGKWKKWDPDKQEWVESYDPFDPPKKGVSPWAIILGAVIVLAGLTFTITALQGGSNEPAKIGTLSPTPTPTSTPATNDREQAVVQRLVAFMASHEENAENVARARDIIITSGCTFEDTNITARSTRADAKGVIAALPYGYEGAVAKMTTKENEGLFLVMGTNATCP